MRSLNEMQQKDSEDITGDVADEEEGGPDPSEETAEIQECAVHKLSLLNVFNLGEKEMKDRDISLLRMKQKERVERLKMFLLRYYNSIFGDVETLNVCRSLTSDDFDDITQTYCVSNDDLMIQMEAFVNRTIDKLPTYIVNFQESAISIDDFKCIGVEAMRRVFHKTPRGYQNDVIPHVLSMISCKHMNIPQPTLVVQPTGSGKSAIPQTVSVSSGGGVSIVLENTLSLGSDQVSKITQLESSTMFAFQADRLTPKQCVKLESIIKEMKTRNVGLTVILFMSPERLLQEFWMKLFSDLVKNKLLRFVCIDEIHQFIMYALTFRQSFQKLRKVIHDNIVIKSPNSVESPTKLEVP